MKTITNLSFVLIVCSLLISCNSDSSGSFFESGLYSDIYDDTPNQFEDYGENPYLSVAENPISTFSIDADGASYAFTRRYLNFNENPPTSSVRVEEFINYFTFNYPEPESGENIGLNSELSTCPWNEAHHLMRIGIKGRTLSEAEMPGSNFVFLIDVSGSMDADDKLELLKEGFLLMVDSMKATDRVAIVTYCDEVKVNLGSTNGDEKSKIRSAINKLSASGSTAGGAAIQKAYQIAEENFKVGGNNRIILGTDGDFNVGLSTDSALVDLIEAKRAIGVYLTVLGVGNGNLNDSMMEKIADSGNGNYEYLDCAEQLQKVFIHERTRFYTVAKDVKVQVTFNAAMVDSFRLIGYENRTMDSASFSNDTVDAGEIGSGQTITALYELKLRYVDASQPYANVDFRYKKPGESNSRLLNMSIQNTPILFSQSSENQRFASAVTGLGLLLKASMYKGSLTREMIVQWGDAARTSDPFGLRAEFVGLVRKVQ